MLANATSHLRRQVRHAVPLRWRTRPSASPAIGTPATLSRVPDASAGPLQAGPGTPLYQRRRRPSRWSTWRTTSAAAEPRPTATLGGAKSTVCVPMLQDDDLVGTITIYRQEVRPFTDQQIELVTTFADQAVIAIENVRLFDDVQKRTRLSEACSSRPRPPTCSRSSAARRSIFSRCSRRWSNWRPACARRTSFRSIDSRRSLPSVASYGQSPEYMECLQTHPLEPGRRTIAGRAA